MKIKTGGFASSKKPDSQGTKNRYLRRKASQKLRKSSLWSWNLRKVFPALARGASVAMALLLVFSLHEYVYTSSQFELQRISIEGNHHADPLELEQVIRNTFPPNILEIDLEDLQGRIEDEVWVLRAEVRRILPSDLQIRIEERRPSSILEIQGQLYVCDQEGLLLQPYESSLASLDVPIFKGLEGENVADYREHQEENAIKIQLGLELLRQLEASSSGLSRIISEVDLSHPRNVKIFLVDELVEVSLGDQDFAARVETLLANMPHYQELKERYGAIATIDLRYENQIIYRPVAMGRAQAKSIETVLTP